MEEANNNNNNNNNNSITISVKFGGKPIPISVSSSSTVKDLKSLLQPLTDVLPRGQKLIFKGKILVDQSTLGQSGVGDGAKVMLLASQGLHQGSGPVLKDAKTRNVQRPGTTEAEPQRGLDDLSSRLKLIKVTGVVSLSRTNLKVIPDQVWDCGSYIRLLDIKDNAIANLPAEIGGLSSLQKLYIDGNDLTNDTVDWEGLASLKQLTILTASHNRFSRLPHGIGMLSSLKQLDISNNRVTSFPSDMGLLIQLEVLKASHNRLAYIPACIGRCTSLVEVDLSANILMELPEEFAKLINLKSLNVSNNGLNSVPPTLFKMCQNLTSLNLHNTEITMDVLRQCEGWEEFDRRRVLKHQKQLDFGVVDAERFDEGADKS